MLQTLTRKEKDPAGCSVKALADEQTYNLNFNRSRQPNNLRDSIKKDKPKTAK